MGDSSRHNLSAIVEVAYGVTPAVTPNFKRVRHTGTTLGLSKSTFQSEELRADRQITDYRHGAKQTGGDIAIELSYGNFDDYLEAVLGGTWAVKATKTATTISATASDSSINDSGNGFILAGFGVGDRVTISGFTGTVGNNQAALFIRTLTAGKMILENAAGVLATFVDDAAGESVTVVTNSNRLKAGVNRRSFSFLREFADIPGTGTKYPFHKFAGQEFSKFTLNVAADAMIKGSFSLVGKGLVLSNTAPAGTTYTAANVFPSMDAFRGALLENGVANAVVTEIQMTLDNGITPRFVVGSDETILPSIGRSNLNGQITAYFEDSTLMQKFLDATETSLQFTLGDTLGNKYIFNLPRVKLNGGQPDTQGQGPITLTIPFQALLDTTLADSQIAIDRLPVAP